MRFASRHSSRILLAAIAGAPLLASHQAFGVLLSGQIGYTDFGGATQPVRDSLVEIYGIDSTDTPKLLTTTTTDPTSGAWSVNCSPPAGYEGLIVTVDAQNGGVVVSDGIDSVYSELVGTTGIDGGAIAPLVINTQTGGDAAKAFMIADAGFTSDLYASQVRSTPLPIVPIVFGEKDTTGIDDGQAYFSPSTVQISIGEGSVYDWDTINHEYGHYMAYVDQLDQNPGGTHTFARSCIPANGRLNGVRLAWGEGLATYNAIMAQQNAPHPASFGNSNLSYDFFDNTKTPATTTVTSIGIENNNDGYVSMGEGDELSVARILWDLADSTNEPHDRVSMGYKAIYSMLATQHFDQLGGLWNYLYTEPNTTDALRADYGGIFQLANVSPNPDAAAINGTTISAADPTAPTFTWLKGNDDGQGETNSLFDIIVFNSNFTTQLLSIPVPGNVDTYTLTQEQWATLDSTPGLDQYVITGEDDTNNSPGVIPAAYWSDAYSFTVAAVPEPPLSAC